MDADEPQAEPAPPFIDIDQLGDYIERTTHLDNLKHEARGLLAELKRIHGKVHERTAAIEGAPINDAELAAIRTNYENHLARGNYVHPMTHDVGRLLGELDRLHERLPVVAAEADKNAGQVYRMFGRMREVENEAMRRGVTTLPLPADGRTQWFTLASLGSQLTAVIDGTPYPYPEPGQDTADFARDQLARAAAAAIWSLLAHAVTTGDEHHFDTFIAALINADRIPEDAAAAVGPAFADLITFLIEAIKTEGTA